MVLESRVEGSLRGKEVSSYYAVRLTTGTEKSFGLFALVRLKELIIDVPGSEIGRDLEELQEVCLQTNVIVVSVDSKLDMMMFYRVREQEFLGTIQIVLPGIELEDG